MKYKIWELMKITQKQQVLLDHWEGRVDSYGLSEQLINIKAKKSVV